jgi:hypothetical protein
MTTPTLVAGDDWEFRITLLKPDGSPYDLAGSPPIYWAMADHDGVRRIQPTDVMVTVTEPAAGKLSVIVPAEKTTPLLVDLYSYDLRIVLGGVTHTPLIGQVHVVADPFAVQTALRRGKIRAIAVA